MHALVQPSCQGGCGCIAAHTYVRSYARTYVPYLTIKTPGSNKHLVAYKRRGQGINIRNKRQAQNKCWVTWAWLQQIATWPEDMASICRSFDVALKLRAVEFAIEKGKKGKEAAAREFDVDLKRFAILTATANSLFESSGSRYNSSLIRGIQTASHKSTLSFHNSCGPRTQSSCVHVVVCKYKE